MALDMTIIQFSIVFLAILMMVKTVLDFRKNKVTLPIFLFWMILWLAIIIVAVLPQVTGLLDKLLSGENRGRNCQRTDLFFYRSWRPGSRSAF